MGKSPCDVTLIKCESQAQTKFDSQMNWLSNFYFRATFLSWNIGMKFLTPVLLVLFFGSFYSATAQEGFELPNDADTPVFSMEFVYGEKVGKPYIQVLADGRVLKSSNTRGDQPFEIQLSEEELNDFLNKCINEYNFYEIDGGQIAKEIVEANADKPRPRMADGPTVQMSMLLGRGGHSYQIYNTKYVAKQYRDIEALQNAVAIENLVRRMGHFAIAGGQANLEHALELVNEALEAKGREPMAIDALSSCFDRNGVVEIVFIQGLAVGKCTIDGDRETVKISFLKK